MFFRKRDTGVSWIIVFLGNPGPRYENTRHNAGFQTADIVEKSIGAKIDRLKYNSLTTVAALGNQRVFLMKPQTYMNLSGSPVKSAMRFYKVPLTNVIVVSDDASLPVGKLRIRKAGSSGGHNGLRDIILKCGGEGFPRIKIGIGAPPSDDYAMSDWVLSAITAPDQSLITDAARRASEALLMLTNNGIDQAIRKFN